MVSSRSSSELAAPRSASVASTRASELKVIARCHASGGTTVRTATRPPTAASPTWRGVARKRRGPVCRSRASTPHPTTPLREPVASTTTDAPPITAPATVQRTALGRSFSQHHQHPTSIRQIMASRLAFAPAVTLAMARKPCARVPCHQLMSAEGTARKRTSMKVVKSPFTSRRPRTKAQMKIRKTSRAKKSCSMSGARSSSFSCTPRPWLGCMLGKMTSECAVERRIRTPIAARTSTCRTRRKERSRLLST